MVEWITMQCLNNIWIEMKWKNVIHMHFTEYHGKMLFIRTSQSTMEKCYSYALHRAPRKNVIHMHFTEYHGKMLFIHTSQSIMEKCYSYALHRVPRKNVIHTHFTEYHRKMLFIRTSQSTMEKCYSYALHKVPWKNVIHMHFTEYHGKMLFICTSQSTTLSENVPLCLNYDNLKKSSSAERLSSSGLWQYQACGQVLTYQSPFYCEQRQRVLPKCRYPPTYQTTRIQGITLENRYGEEMGYGRQYSDLGKGEPTEGMWYHSSIILNVQRLHLRPTQPPIHFVKMGSVSGGSSWVMKITNDFQNTTFVNVTHENFKFVSDTIVDQQLQNGTHSNDALKSPDDGEQIDKSHMTFI